MTEPRRGRRWAELFTVGFGTAVAVGGMQQALRGLLIGTPWNWAEMALYVLLWTAIMPPCWWLIGRTAGRGSASHGPVLRTRAQLKELLASALRAGALPLAANPEFWRPALGDEVLRWNALRWVSAGLAVLDGSLSARRLHVARRLLAELPAS